MTPRNAGVKHDGLHLSFLFWMILSSRACMCNTFATVRLFSPFVSIQIGEFPQGNLPLYHKTGRGAILQTTSRASARGCNLNFSNSVPGAVSLPQCSLRILILQNWPWLRVLVSPRAPHLSGALEARGRGATLGRYPGERKRDDIEAGFSRPASTSWAEGLAHMNDRESNYFEPLAQTLFCSLPWIA